MLLILDILSAARPTWGKFVDSSGGMEMFCVPGESEKDLGFPSDLHAMAMWKGLVTQVWKRRSFQYRFCHRVNLVKVNLVIFRRSKQVA